MHKRPASNEDKEIDESKSNEPIGEELGEEELNAVSGGIIFVGGHNNIVPQPSKSPISNSDRQTLNPQFIPPGPPAKNQ